MQRKCDWCHDPFTDTVTSNEHNKGAEWQEVEVDDIPSLCPSCNEKAKDKNKL